MIFPAKASSIDIDVTTLVIGAQVDDQYSTRPQRAAAVVVEGRRAQLLGLSVALEAVDQQYVVGLVPLGDVVGPVGADDREAVVVVRQAERRAQGDDFRRDLDGGE